MRAFRISGIVMAVAAVVIAVAYWGYGRTPVELLSLGYDLVRVDRDYICKPLRVKE